MKTLRTIFLLYVVSVAIAIGLSFINDDAVVYTTEVKIYEIIFLSLLVFLVLLMFYFVNKMVGKALRMAQNKKPSVKEGPNLKN